MLGKQIELSMLYKLLIFRSLIMTKSGSASKEAHV